VLIINELKMRPEIGAIDSSSYDVTFIDAFIFALLSFGSILLPKYNNIV